MATPPLTSSPRILENGTRFPRHTDLVPASSPPPFISTRRASLKRTSSSSSSLDPESPSDRPSKRLAGRGSFKRTNSISSIAEVTDENARPPSKFPATPPRILKRMPSLLPAIDFQQSPPRPSRPEHTEELLQPRQTHYPTPVPTSDLGHIPTSPPRKVTAEAAVTGASRQSLRRTDSAISELRAPLASVPTVTLPTETNWITFGRSANKCTYLLSKSHLVSRVHFKVIYNRWGLRKVVEVHCIGYNGGKIHCRNEVWEIRHGDVFWSESGADLMLEIEDARVLLQVPRNSPTSPLSPMPRSVVLDPEDFPFPPEYNIDGEKQRRSWPTEGIHSFGRHNSDPIPVLRTPTPKNGQVQPQEAIEATRSRPAPIRASRDQWVYGPDSPCPLARKPRVVPASPANPFTSMTSQATFTLYEDEDDAVHEIPEPVESSVDEDDSVLRESEKPEALNTEVEVDDDEDEEEDDNEDEKGDESDGENLDSPIRIPRKVLKNRHKLDMSVQQDPLTPKSKQSITKHLINQLAFSRLASTPLSNLYTTLPPPITQKVNVDFVQGLLTTVACIGEIKREGKDASGKPLEAEYYYIAEQDDDSDRKALVESLNKPSLRACRKTHKQYFWKKPKV
ncbi:hypothetical protein TWF694_011612 [Orbilia ellipsospora]|uniref:FHA domain-containing protein n=1 Tax=Orbilia ellipsospora TaxID=2528407 RepID=A0AAV9X5Q1_9PEZI